MIQGPKQDGFVALISILILGALILLIAVGISLRSVSQTQMGIAEQQSHKASALANLCAEQALMKLKTVLQYAGNESIMIDGETCDILNIDGSGNLNRTVQTESIVSKHTKRVQIEIAQISPEMQITSWKEVADF